MSSSVKFHSRTKLYEEKPIPTVENNTSSSKQKLLQRTKNFNQFLYKQVTPNKIMNFQSMKSVLLETHGTCP
jgi:hypothetical protein